MTHDADAIARLAAAAMWADDRASQALGMTLDRVRAGRSVMSMTVTSAMVNGHGLCHGGYIFLLADSAFAFACNSYNQRTVAQHCAVTFIKPGKLGDKLTATAVERSRTGRSGIYDITVTKGAGPGVPGEIIAEFRGHSRAIGGELVPTAVGSP